MTTSPRFLIIGNAANRRVTLFLAALAEQGLEADVVAWVDLLRSFSVLEAIEGPRLVRIDSYGEDFAVERELLRRGGFPEAETIAERHGEVLAPALSYLGFQGVLRSDQRDLGQQGRSRQPPLHSRIADEAVRRLQLPSHDHRTRG